MSICAGILAGGESRRFGSDKALAPWHGRSLLAHLIDSVRLQVDAMLISVRHQHSTAYAQFGLPLVVDQVGAGPLAGLAALLNRCQHDWLLLLPCDALTVASDWASRMRARAESQHARLVICHDGQREHPTFALVHRELRSAVTQALTTGERGLYRWQQSIVDRALLHTAAPLNINTVDQLLQLAGSDGLAAT